MKQAATELGHLADAIRVCTRCRLHESRTIAVPGEGAANARVMLVGEGPGAQEDDTGRPFIGRSGQYLTELLARAGLTRDEVFITSAVKCRPPKNRTPRADELRVCGSTWLARQVELIDPKLIVLLGRTGAVSLLGKVGPLSDLHGTVREHEGRRYFFTYHPAAGLRYPHFRTPLEADFDRLGELVREL